MATSILTDLAIRLRAQTADLKKGLDRAKGSVNGYKNNTQKGMKDVGKSFKKMGSEANYALASMGGGFGKMNFVVAQGIGVIKGLSNSMRGLKAVLISTGIGAIFVAIGTAIAALSSYFKNTVDGAQKFAKISGTVKGIFLALRDVLIRVGRFLSEMFENPAEGFKRLGEIIKNNLVARFEGMIGIFKSGFNAITAGAKGVGLALAGIFNKEKRAEAEKYFSQMKTHLVEMGEAGVQMMTGISAEKIYSGVRKVGSEIEKTSKTIADLEVRRINLRLRLANFQVSEAKAVTEIARLTEISSDKLLEYSDRYAATNKAIEETNKLYSQKVNHAKEALAIQREENAAGESSVADIEKEKQLEADLIALEKTRLDKIRELKNRNEEITASWKNADKQMAKFYTTVAKQIDDAADKAEESFIDSIEAMVAAVDADLGDIDPVNVEVLSPWDIWQMDGVNAMSKLSYAFESGFAEMAAQSLDVAGMMREAFLTTLGSVQGAFETLFAGQKGGWKEVATAAVNSIGQIIQALLAQAIAAVIAKESQKGLIGLVLASVGVSALLALWNAKVPKLAQGGIASSPTLALVGEYPNASSDPEVIAPLSKLKSILGSSGGMGGRVEFEIDGHVLKGVLNKMNKLDNIG